MVFNMFYITWEFFDYFSFISCFSFFFLPSFLLTVGIISGALFSLLVVWEQISIFLDDLQQLMNQLCNQNYHCPNYHVSICSTSRRFLQIFQIPLLTWSVLSWISDSGSGIFEGSFTDKHAWALGGFARVFTPPGQKVNVTVIPTPESKSKLITYRYRLPPPRIFPQPTYADKFITAA